MSPTGYPFTLVSAFTQDTFSGNPAAILFLDKPLSPETYQKIAANFNQPVTSFVYPSATPSSSDGTVANYEISWNTPTVPLRLCGHGTIAAAKSVLTRPELVGATLVCSMNFKAASGVVLTATRILQDDGEWFEITLPAGETYQLSPEETDRISGVIRRAVGKEDLTIKFVGWGVGRFDNRIMIELDEKDDLAGMTVNPQIIVSVIRRHKSLADWTRQLETGYEDVILTTDCSKPDGAAYLVRVFLPALGIDEDQACASSNCLTGPYWAAKKGLESVEMKVRQVSPRGGEFKVKTSQNEISLRGQVKVVASGELFL